MPLEEGSRAPDFELPDHEGRPFRLSEALARLKALVLYFYPRAMTPGCTREALRFNEILDEIRALGADVVGVSTDSVQAIKRFREKYGLRFTLLSDREGKVAEAYGVLKRGTRRPSAERVTFLIDASGVVRAVIKGVRPAEKHADLALERLRDILGE